MDTGDRERITESITNLLARIDCLQAQINAITGIARAARDYIQQVPEDSLLNDLVIAIEYGLAAAHDARWRA